MKSIITITRKGQTTLPAAMRRKLGLDKSGGILEIKLNEAKGEIVISKPVTASELSNRVSRYIKPGTTPLANVSDYYQTHRTAGT